MQLPQPVEREKKHHRKIDCEGFLRSDGLYDIDVHMIDTRTYDCPYVDFHRGGLVRAGEPIHDMWLRFTIDIDYLIHDVQATSERTPFEACPNAAASMRELIGLRIVGGWLKQARERVAPTVSCTHLMDLLGQMAATAYQTLHADREKRDAGLPDREKPPILDTCLGLSSSGEAVKSLWPKFYVDKQAEESKS